MNNKPKKSLGQNFLKDDKYINQIIKHSNISKNDVILEIGPGTGALTDKLIKIVDKLICVELDDDLAIQLNEKYGNINNFEVINNDFLKIDFDEEINRKVKVIANIPYYITSPIINKLIRNRKYISEIIIMTQKEVAERICGIQTRDSSILTLFVAYYATSKILFEVPADAFYPIPKVDSAVMKIEFFNENEVTREIDIDTFMKYIKASFANKRKNILNNLTKLGYDKKNIKSLLDENGIDFRKRAEKFNVEEFINLIKILEKTSV